MTTLLTRTASTLVLFAAAACGPGGAADASVPDAGTAATATAAIEARSMSMTTGTARFVESGGQVTVTVTVAGATPGMHGVHVHMTGDCSAADAMSAGGHFDPDGMAHGDPSAPTHHAGDLGNLTVSADGTGTLTLTTSRLTVAAGAASVVGRAVVVHAMADDLMTAPTGNSGARVGCGVVALSM